MKETQDSVSFPSPPAQKHAKSQPLTTAHAALKGMEDHRTNIAHIPFERGTGTRTKKPMPVPAQLRFEPQPRHPHPRRPNARSFIHSRHRTKPYYVAADALKHCAENGSSKRLSLSLSLSLSLVSGIARARRGAQRGWTFISFFILAAAISMCTLTFLFESPPWSDSIFMFGMLDEH